MEETFLQILSFNGSKGYYARTEKEKDVMLSLERRNLIHRKPGTKRVYILSSDLEKPNSNNTSNFKVLLKKYFIEARTIMQPFVPIDELRDIFINKGMKKEFFDQLLIELYDKNELELEKSFTGEEGNKNGLNYKNKKYFSFIMNID
jgi:hypothetical protein